MTGAELRPYVEALPRLQAEESLTHVAEHAIGSGVASKEQQRRVLGAWRKAAQQAPDRRRVPGETRAIQLASIGIGVVKVRKDKGSGHPG